MSVPALRKQRQRMPRVQGQLVLYSVFHACQGYNVTPHPSFSPQSNRRQKYGLVDQLSVCRSNQTVDSGPGGRL